MTHDGNKKDIPDEKIPEIDGQCGPSKFQNMTININSMHNYQYNQQYTLHLLNPKLTTRHTKHPLQSTTTWPIQHTHSTRPKIGSKSQSVQSPTSL